MPIAPSRPVPLLPPGTYIEEWIEDNNLNQKELASKLGTSRKHLNQVINGRQDISSDFAQRLDSVTGIPAEFWLVHQAKYEARLSKLAVSSEDISVMKEVFPTKCVSRLRAEGVIKNSWRQGEELVRELFRRLKIASSSALDAELLKWPVVAYRQSSAYTVQPGPLWSWLWIAEERALEISAELPLYDEERLLEKIPALRKITRETPENFVQRVQGELAECGVGFVALKDISGARVFGATFLQEATPVICVSDRFKREDIFWFTLFHEIAHVLHDDLSSPLVNVDSGEETNGLDIEKRANEWAENALLTKDQIAQLPRIKSKDQVEQIARDLNVSPGILMGRLHHLRIKDHSWGNDMIRSFSIPE